MTLSAKFRKAAKNSYKVFKGINIAACSIFFMLAGVLHFLKTDMYEEIMPEYLPVPVFLVLFSGVCEIAGGAGLMFPRLRRLASFGLIALLIAVFPANLNMAMNSIDFGMPHEWLFWRLPFQAVFILWVYWCGKTNHSEESK